MQNYAMRGMSRRYMEGAPEDVRKAIVDIIAIIPAAPLEYDVVWRENTEGYYVGLDFGKGGEQGCHFYLKRHEMRAYRERNRRKRVAWKDLPADTQNAILAYIREPNDA